MAGFGKDVLLKNRTFLRIRDNVESLIDQGASIEVMFNTIRETMKDNAGVGEGEGGESQVDSLQPGHKVNKHGEPYNPLTHAPCSKEGGKLKPIDLFEINYTTDPVTIPINCRYCQKKNREYQEMTKAKKIKERNAAEDGDYKPAKETKGVEEDDEDDDKKAEETTERKAAGANQTAKKRKAGAMSSDE